LSCVVVLLHYGWLRVLGAGLVYQGWCQSQLPWLGFVRQADVAGDVCVVSGRCGLVPCCGPLMSRRVYVGATPRALLSVLLRSLSCQHCGTVCTTHHRSAPLTHSPVCVQRNGATQLPGMGAHKVR
jgi:hypothetical protein